MYGDIMTAKDRLTKKHRVKGIFGKRGTPLEKALDKVKGAKAKSKMK